MSHLDITMYPVSCYSGFALFFLQDPSVLVFQRRFEDQIKSNNLRTGIGTNRFPQIPN
jgi:hypothetical protein